MSQDTWKDVKSKVEGLGLKLKLHLEQEEDEADETARPGETRAAFEELGDKIQEAFSSFGNAAKDPAVRSDVKEIGLLLKDALQETFANVGAEVGDKMKSAADKMGQTKGQRAAESAADAANAGAQDTTVDSPTEDTGS